MSVTQVLEATPFRLGNTNRWELITPLWARARNQARGDSLKWAEDLTPEAWEEAITPYPIKTGEEKLEAYRKANRANNESIVAAENRKREDQQVKKLEAFAKLKKMTDDRKAANAGVVNLTEGKESTTVGVVATKKRVNWQGLTATPLALWMHENGFTVDNALKIFPKLGFTVAESTIRQVLKYGIPGIKMPNVTDAQRKELEVMK